jgi:hypothetical protein
MTTAAMLSVLLGWNLNIRLKQDATEYQAALWLR